MPQITSEAQSQVPNLFFFFLFFYFRTGKFDLEVTTFQMAVLFCWENRRDDKISLENLRSEKGNPVIKIYESSISVIYMAFLVDFKERINIFIPIFRKYQKISEENARSLNKI